MFAQEIQRRINITRCRRSVRVMCLRRNITGAVTEVAQVQPQRAETFLSQTAADINIHPTGACVVPGATVDKNQQRLFMIWLMRLSHNSGHGTLGRDEQAPLMAMLKYQWFTFMLLEPSVFLFLRTHIVEPIKYGCDIVYGNLGNLRLLHHPLKP